MVGSSYEDSRGWYATVKRKSGTALGRGVGEVRNLNSVLPKAAVLREHCHLAAAAKAVFSLLSSDLFTVSHLDIFEETSNSALRKGMGLHQGWLLPAAVWGWGWAAEFTGFIKHGL